MTQRLGILTREEEDAILEMRDPRWVAYEAGHMARVLQAALRGPDAYEVSDAAAWMAGRVCTALDRISDILKPDAKGAA